MILLTISKEEANSRLLRFLNKLLPKAPNSFWYKAVRTKKIRLNQKHVKELSMILAEGDVLSLYVTDQQLMEFGYKAQEKAIKPLKTPSIEVLYEDDVLLVINKPRGILTQKAKASDISLTEAARQYLYEKGYPQSATFQPSFCHRLDRNTSGVLIMAKTLKAQQVITSHLKDHSIEKLYLALVKGQPLLWKEETLLTHVYRKDPVNNKAMILDPQQAKEGDQECRLTVSLVETYGDASLLQIHLLTGKSHQIRAQLSHMGYPILGDGKYDPKEETYQQMLTAHAVVFHGFEEDFAYLNEKRIEAPLPKDMTRYIQEAKR